jgi:hypothetical protein
MKYAITGHTNGIGKRLYERLTPNAVGFSLTSGYNINNLTDRLKILKEIPDVDVFINNAYTGGFGQVQMFLDVFKIWKNNPSKKIINVGSRIADIESLPPYLDELLEYQSAKIALKEMSYRVKGNCKILYKSFAYVGTEKILKKYPHFTPANYITVDSAADIILS